jgi:DNA-binding MarR family transcriptional regulator
MDAATERAAELAADLRVLVGRLNRRLRDEAQQVGSDLSWSQLKVLSRLERDGPATVTALAQAEGIRPQSMSATISVLKEAGLVAGTPDPTDGRQTVLSLTDQCRRLLLASRTAKTDWLFRALQTTLTPAEQDDLASALSLLRRLIES